MLQFSLLCLNSSFWKIIHEIVVISLVFFPFDGFILRVSSRLFLMTFASILKMPPRQIFIPAIYKGIPIWGQNSKMYCYLFEKVFCIFSRHRMRFWLTLSSIQTEKEGSSADEFYLFSRWNVFKHRYIQYVVTVRNSS